MSLGSQAAMVRPLDHVADVNGAELYRLSKLYDLPPVVKQASLAAVRPPAGLAAAAYGNPDARLYPCHSPAATVLSVLFFEDAAKRASAEDPKSAARLRQRFDAFADYWGVKAAVDALRSHAAELHKQAASQESDADYAIVWRLDDGRVERHCRMKSAAEVAAAADYLHRHRDAFTFADRRLVAERVREKAAAFGASLPPALERFVETQVGHGVCDPADAYALVRDRALLAPPGAIREQVMKLAEAIQTKTAAALGGGGQLLSLAETIDTLDRTVLKLAGRYTDRIPRPEDVLFKVTYNEVKAAADSAVPLVTGNIYDSTQFTRVPLEEVSALFGSDVARDVAFGLEVNPVKLAEVAKTFVRSDAETFESMLGQLGIPPLRSKAASVPYAGPLSGDGVQELAAAY